MNRRSLPQRAAMLTIVAILACGWVRMADAQGGMQGMAQSLSESRDFKVYRLRYADPSFVTSALQELMRDDKPTSIRMMAGVDGTLLLFAPPEMYKKIDEVIKAIDVPHAKEPEVQIKVFTLMNTEPASAARVLATLLPKSTRVAIDERTRSLVVSGPRESMEIAAAVLERLDVGAKVERRKPSATYEVRVLWLANVDKGSPPADDLKDVVAELSRLGVKDPRQVGQMVIRTSPGGSFDLSSVPEFAGYPANLSASGRLLEESEGGLVMQIAIRATAGSPQQMPGLPQQKLYDISTRIVLPQKQYVVLAIAPVREVTSAFVVQVTSRAQVVEKDAAAPSNNPRAPRS
jgi:hypothetical protein